MSYNILTGDPTRPTPTGLASAPLPPRRKLRDGRDSSSASSGSSAAGGVSSGRGGNRARGKGLGRGRGGRDSDGSRASSRASSGRGESRASHEPSTAPSTRPVTPRMNGFGPVAPIAPPLAAPSSASASPSASAANSTNNRPAGGNMDFMRELGWEVHDDPNIQTAFEMEMAHGPNGRYPNGLEGREDGDRGWILGDGAVGASDRVYAEYGGQGRDAASTSQGNADMVEDLIDPDLAEFSTHPDEFADAAEPDPWDANHPNHPYPQHHRAARASSTRGAGSGGGRINAFVSGRSPSPTAGADAGSRSPSPALPLPLAISARNMMAGHGPAVQAESDFAFDFAGGADGAEGQDGVQVLPEWDDEYEAQLANNNHAAHPAPMQTDEGRVARTGGSALLDRLDAWNDANDAYSAAPDIASDRTRTRTRARPAPAALPTHDEAINGDSLDGPDGTDGGAMRNPSTDSIVMLDGPPASASRPNGTGARGVGIDDAPIAISGSSGSSGSGSGSGGSAGGSGNSSPAEGSDGAGAGTGRRYTREEKGKGRAVPITRTTRGARADRRSNTEAAGTMNGDSEQEPRLSRRSRPIVHGVEHTPGHAAAELVMGESDADADVEYTGRSKGRRQTKKRIRGSDEEDELAGDSDPELFGSGNTADDGDVEMEGGIDVGNDSVQWIDPPSPVAAKRNEGRRSKRAKVEGEVGVKVEDELGGEEEASYEREEERPEDKLQGLDTQTCPVCFDALSKPVMTLCGHVHCYGCLTSTLIHSIKANPNPHPGQWAPITAAGRGRNGQPMVAHRTANQRAAGRGGRGGGRTNGRGNKAAAALLDPTILPAGSAELQPAQWTAPLLAAALREHKLQRELEQYIQAGMDANDAQAALDAVHADDAPIPDETAANRGEVMGVRERLKGLWEVDAQAMPPRGQQPGGSGSGGGTGRGGGGNLRVMDRYWVIEGECPICRVPLPGGLGPWDSGIGGVIPLGAVLVDRSRKGRRRAKVEL